MGQERKRYFSNVLFLICFILGILVTLQIKNQKDNLILYNGETIREMKYQLEKETSDLEILEEYKTRKMTELDSFKFASSEDGIEELLNSQLKYATMISQRVTFKGEGLEISLSDSERNILPNQNPNDFIIHDQDVLRIVNDLKSAGAEIISINNQVIRNTTEIKCSGATITINGKTFAQPFIIRAIGDKELLEAAVKSKESYAYMIENIYGIKVTATKKEKIIIDATINNKDFRYIKEG